MALKSVFWLSSDPCPHGDGGPVLRQNEEVMVDALVYLQFFHSIIKILFVVLYLDPADESKSYTD